MDPGKDLGWKPPGLEGGSSGLSYASALPAAAPHLYPVPALSPPSCPSCRRSPLLPLPVALRPLSNLSGEEDLEEGLGQSGMGWGRLLCRLEGPTLIRGGGLTAQVLAVRKCLFFKEHNLPGFGLLQIRPLRRVHLPAHGQLLADTCTAAGRCPVVDAVVPENPHLEVDSIDWPMYQDGRHCGVLCSRE